MFNNYSHIKKSLFGFVGKGKEDINLKPIYEAKLDDEFVALAFSCRISVKVKEFMISLESNIKIKYYSKVIDPLDFLKNRQFLYFNFYLKFDNSNHYELRNPPRTINLDPFISFQMLRSCLIEDGNTVRDLYEFSLGFVNENNDLLIELLNLIKEENLSSKKLY